MSGPLEADFEHAIAQWLVKYGGYTGPVKNGLGQGDPRHFDPVRGIDTAELFEFIGATQIDEWNRLIKLHGGDPDVAQAKFADRLAKQIDALGTIEVLRRGVDDLGVTIRLAYFKPAHALNPEAADRYAANRLTVTRQLPFEQASTKTLDLCLFVNGLPVATVELKTHLTGQTAKDAIKQYESRDAKNLTLSKRAIVHFAVDTEVAWMTTKLAGSSTRFLQFNRGRDNGAGNLDNKDGHRTSYLWEQVWQSDAWMDLLGRFVHVEPTAKGLKGLGTLIFPRYHQWDAVLKMEDHAREHGAGHNYLVQHSAGSGKSNTIAWLAHSLSSLHNTENSKVFDKVVVITDRVVLDRQLQATIGQFERVSGVVQKIDESSQQLADSLTGEQARIIITTIQKFPYVLEKIAELPGRSYAVIADEAHSSQSGETAKDLKKVLGAGQTSPEAMLQAAEAEELSLIDEVPDPVEDALAAEVDARGRQPNLSFFAFTATPKAKTLELFGTPAETDGDRKFEAFHLYSMRQAIEEGYIYDVLANYTTYQTYWKIEKAVEDDPEYDPGKAKAAIAKYVSLHEHNLSQKSDIIIRHFREKVAKEVGGKAKAMVVTSSRLHALRYGLALRNYCDDHGIGDVGVLVAFSGTLNDEGSDWTETIINGFPESQTPKQFDTDDWQILVVAEKYQTGFDQPKLHTMYVDKPLTGLAAVQTLSRLNRTHPDKDSTFVLDFRNEADHIRDAFAPWYVQTLAPPTDPNIMWDAHRQLGDYDVLRWEETQAFAQVLLANPKDSVRVYGMLEGAKSRFWNDLDEEEQDRFRDALKKFVSAYSYLSQIVPFGDVKLERDFLFCKALAQFIRKKTESLPDISDEVNLEYLATKVTSEGSITLPDDEGQIEGITEIGGRPGLPDDQLLSQIIAKLNERHGTNFDPADRVFFDGLVEKMANRTDVQQAAVANSPENFGLIMKDGFQDGVIDQMGVAQDITKHFLDDGEFAATVLQAYMPLLQTKAKIAHQQHCAIVELLERGEDSWLEYKSTFRVDASTGELFKPVETAALKSVAAFLNSWDGGTLLLGIAEDDRGLGVPFGLELDYATVHKDGKDDADMFLLALTDVMKASMGAAAISNVTTQIHSVDGKDICRVHVKPCGFPVGAKVTEIKKGQHQKLTNFYARINNGAHKFVDEEEKQKYIAQRWPGV